MEFNPEKFTGISKQLRSEESRESGRQELADLMAVLVGEDREYFGDSELREKIENAVASFPAKERRNIISELQNITKEAGWKTAHDIVAGALDLDKEIERTVGQREQIEIYRHTVRRPENIQHFKDFMNPERIVYGTESETARRVLHLVHEKLACPKIETTVPSSELIKYASNAFLATKISFINEIANVCESVGADIDIVSYGMGLDSRIGHKFLKAGLGYGGSCFPKDVRALQSISGENGYQFQLLKVVIDVNNHQRWKFFHKIKNILGDLNNKEITIWGLAFKANTDDIRESIAIDLALKLIEEGAKVRVYDPKAMENACKVLGQENVVYFFNALDACHGADALIIGTEWPEFQEIDIVQLRNVMKSQIIFDGRNLLDKNKLLNLDFKYYSIGR